MAKIDVSNISGYADMTAEQKLAALEGYELPETDYSGYIKKDVFDRTASELADLKKKHKSLISDDERKKEEDAENLKKMQEELNELRMGKQVSEHKARYIALGYDEALAESSAKAMLSGDMSTVFENQKKFLDSHDKSLKASVLKDTPVPPAGGGDNTNNFASAIADALARNDYGTAAAYMRKQQEQSF